jgi:archaellum component FlaC
MKIEQRELEHESQISKMEERLTAMHESPLASTLTKETSDRIADLKEKFENLKWRNTSLQEENKSLRLKLERAQDGSTTKRSMALEVENLEKRVEELEGEKSEWTASTTPTSRVQSSTQSTQPSSKPPTPPSESSSARARSVKRNGSTSRGTKAASPSPIRTAGQSPVGSPSKSTKAPAGSPGRFFLKRRPQKDSGGAEAPKDDASAASKLTF